MRDLSTELLTFVLEHWLPFAAFTSAAPAFADDPGYILLRGELAAPDPYLELAGGQGRASGQGVHLLRFRPGPVWVDVPSDVAADPGTLESTAQGMAGARVNGLYERVGKHGWRCSCHKADCGRCAEFKCVLHYMSSRTICSLDPPLPGGEVHPAQDSRAG